MMNIPQINQKSEYRILYSNVNYLNENVLTHLYLPLIGSAAFQLYNWLRSEQVLGVSNADGLNQSHERILAYLNISFNTFLNAKKTLEQYKLLITYFDEVNNIFLYYLQSPLSIDEFLQDVVLKTKLQQQVGKEEFERTLMFLKPLDLSGIYADISDSEELSLQTTTVVTNEHITLKNYQFNFAQLFADLLKQNVILNLDEVEHDVLESYYLSNQFTYQFLFEAIKICLIPVQGRSNTYKLELSKFHNILKQQALNQDVTKNLEITSNAVSNKRNAKLFSDENFNLTEQDAILAWYENYSFEQFYQIVLKETPGVTLKKHLKVLQNRYNFDHAILNMVLDFELFEIGKFNLNYFKKVCQTLNNLNLTSPLEVLAHLRSFKHANKQETLKKQEQQIFTSLSPNNNDVNDAIFDFLKS